MEDNHANHNSLEGNASTSSNLFNNLTFLKKDLNMDKNYDLSFREIRIGDKNACFVFIDSLIKDDLMEKVIQFLLEIKDDSPLTDPYTFIQSKIPTLEVTLENKFESIEIQILSGVFVLFLDGFSDAILIDARTYPARNVAEPDREKSLRGAKDGFVETLSKNTALIRRRIRHPSLTIEMLQIGEFSHTDVAIIYLNSIVSKTLLEKIQHKLQHMNPKALSLSQETLAENIYHGIWLNPFPKIRYTERPDTTCAQLLEGNVVVMVDNSPYAMIFPSTIYDFIEEADDFYFPPITGTYLRISRFLIAIFSFILAPLFLLMMQNQSLVPASMQFLLLGEPENVPVLLQFLIMELAIDGLRLASVNTPSMLSTPLSVMAGLVLGEFSVSSGFFNREVMLIMAFVAVANYTQTSYEIGYAFKFMRILTLILTFFFNIYGFLFGLAFTLFCMLTNKTIIGTPYLKAYGEAPGFRFFSHLIRRRK